MKRDNNAANAVGALAGAAELDRRDARVRPIKRESPARVIFEIHQKLIDFGITYNTATADAVATEVICENITRTLCRTKKGKWFFLSQIENYAGGIQPITATTAIVWLHGQGLLRLVGKYFPGLQDCRDLELGRVRNYGQSNSALAKERNNNAQ